MIKKREQVQLCHDSISMSAENKLNGCLNIDDTAVGGYTSLDNKKNNNKKEI